MPRSILRSRQLRDGRGDVATGTAVGGGGGTAAAGTTGTSIGAGTGAATGQAAGSQNQTATGQSATGTGQLNQNGGQGTAQPTGQQGDEQLGEGGMRALQSERAMRAAEKQRADAAEQQLRELQAATQTDQERAITAAREEGRQQAATVANVQLVRFAVQASAATAGFADPMDAVAQLQERTGEITVTPEGVVDQAAVTAMVTKLAQDKPYLLAEQKAPAFAHNAGQGAGRSGGQAVTGTVAAGADLYRQRNQKQ